MHNTHLYDIHLLRPSSLMVLFLYPHLCVPSFTFFPVREVFTVVLNTHFLSHKCFLVTHHCSSVRTLFVHFLHFSTHVSFYYQFYKFCVKSIFYHFCQFFSSSFSSCSFSSLTLRSLLHPTALHVAGTSQGVPIPPDQQILLHSVRAQQ